VVHFHREDWKRLQETLGHDYQRDFEQAGVKTLYQINIPLDDNRKTETILLV